MPADRRRRHGRSHLRPGGGHAHVNLPGLGTVHNIVTEIGSNGVIGVKSGYTSKAGGCMVLAADQVVGGPSVLVLAAVLGQPTPPPIVPTTTTTAPRPAPTTTTTTTTVPRLRQLPAPRRSRRRRHPHPLRLPPPHRCRPPPRRPSRSTTSRCRIRSGTPDRWPSALPPCRHGWCGVRAGGHPGRHRGHGHRRVGWQAAPGGGGGGAVGLAAGMAGPAGDGDDHAAPGSPRRQRGTGAGTARFTLGTQSSRSRCSWAPRCPSRRGGGGWSTDEA